MDFSYLPIYGVVGFGPRTTIVTSFTLSTLFAPGNARLSIGIILVTDASNSPVSEPSATTAYK